MYAINTFSPFSSIVLYYIFCRRMSRAYCVFLQKILHNFMYFLQYKDDYGVQIVQIFDFFLHAVAPPPFFMLYY